MVDKIRKIEYSAKDKDGKDITGMVRSDLASVEKLRCAIRRALSEAGFDVVSIEVHGIIPKGESRDIQNAMHGGDIS